MTYAAATRRLRSLTPIFALVCALAVLPLPGRAAEARLPGKFVWFDLVTDDLAVEEKFYSAVFGWKFRVVGSSPQSYTVITNGADDIGGMFFRARPSNEAKSARWLSYLSVSDPAAAERYAKQQGSTVIVPLATIAGRGMHLLLRDPQGAVFGLLKTQLGDPPDSPVEPGDVFWMDLLTPDPVRASAFYSGLAGYDVTLPEDDDARKRIVLASEGFARAGVVPLPPAVKQSGWLMYILVDDIPAALAAVAAAGGTVLLQPRADLLDGKVAIIQDPRGGVVGIVDWPDRSGPGAPPSGQEAK